MLAMTVVMGSPLVADVVTKEEVREQMLHVIDSAAVRYRNRLNTSAYRTLQEEIIAQSKLRLEVLNKKKRDIRLQIADLKQKMDEQEKEVATMREQKMKLQSAAVDKREAIRDILARQHLQNMVDTSGPEIFRFLLSGLQTHSLTENTLDALEQESILEVQLQLANQSQEIADRIAIEEQGLHSAAGNLAAEYETLIGRLAHAQQDYLEELDRQENAKTGLLLSQSQLNAVKNDLAKIHSEVLALQKQMARISARKVREDERKLIELGLLPAKSEGYSPENTLQDAKQMFRWPVTGPISAGFRDASYLRYFGFPHNAIDIVVPQLTPVRAAADGTIFVVRDGGQTGYSYLLMGHDMGYATLYGHVFKFLVAPGQDVKQGDVIALSGGMPGEYGTGPTSTNPHLHFEVFQGGVNVDPRSVLP